MNELLQAAEARLTTIVEHYEKTAPTVSEWADDVYRRMHGNADAVRLSELMLADNLLNPEPMHPNYAANRVYKLMSRLDMETTGHAGF